LGQVKTEIFLQKGLDSKSVICPVGQISKQLLGRNRLQCRILIQSVIPGRA
jgi:hypothetical protein